MQDFEKLGTFYLGKTYDLPSKHRTDDLVLYDARDLVTHAVCVGMTGSGKTGLCIGLLEEAAIDGIPSIVIDPKGDLANLLLTFPELKPQDFRPWINEEDAKRKAQTPDEFAAAQAASWAAGLNQWGQSGDRIAKLRAAADCRIYTPGSNAGIPVSVLKSFAPPPQELLDDAELFRERVANTVTSLLGLIGMTGDEADSTQSREHVLLSSILAEAWSNRADLDLGALIHRIQQPPFTRIGVMELESFYPAKDRAGLAMKINTLLASPGFGVWMEGEPLDIANILYTPEGKPRIAIFSIAHLGESERMFFVSLLLNQVLGWTRAQSGTTSLRAIVYMDEISGYFPPVANPPSKRPLLTLMKQARAFGVGVVLVTQNPVDIDYKGLSNAGTWFIGRLQTDRDKARVLDGLEGAAAAASSAFDRAAADRAMSALGNRVFLMNNVHDDGPTIFESRWALSYLRGPLTRQQIKILMDPIKAAASPTRTSAPPTVSTATSPAPAPRASSPLAASGPGASTRPVLPADIPSFFVPRRADKPADATLRYEPGLLGAAKVYYSDPKSGVEAEREAHYVCAFSAGAVLIDWDTAEETDLTDSDLERDPTSFSGSTGFAPLPPDAAKAKSYDAWKKSFADMLFRRDKLELFKSEILGEISKADESERDFRLRLTQTAREQRDALSEKLRQKYAPKLTALQDRIRKAEQAVAKQKEQATDAKLSTALSFGAAILGAFLGKKAISAGSVGKAATAVKGIGRSARESADVDRATENVDALQQQLVDLEAQFKADVDAQAARFDISGESLAKLTLKPKKTNITVRALVLAWRPYWAAPDGSATPAW